MQLKFKQFFFFLDARSSEGGGNVPSRIGESLGESLMEGDGGGDGNWNEKHWSI